MNNIFETRSVALASFLMLEGIEYMGCDRAKENEKIIVMRFKDSRQNCRDLERVFMGSDYKKFHDLNRYLLNEIHKNKEF